LPHHLGQKQFAKDTVYNAHLSGKKHKKAAEKLGEDAHKVSPQELHRKKLEEKKEESKGIAKKEFIIRKIMNALEQQRDATAANVERKQTLTEAERLV
jgi:splicing factor 3A subunit 3